MSNLEHLISPTFSQRIIEWQIQYGRHDLPWQNTRDAYRIWLSEIMLQQTQVATMLPYYKRFLQHFPSLQTLAHGAAEEVMTLWSGLGYYARARNLHRCAQIVCSEYGGVFPQNPSRLAQLPGIGRSTAGAIAAFAYSQRAAILDGNVKRVFSRFLGIQQHLETKSTLAQLWKSAEDFLPEKNIEAYTQGLMDLGATLCTRKHPNCISCPLKIECVALHQGRVDELPLAKPRTRLPEKWGIFLLFYNQKKFLLQRRPSTGIWGGLLSLPEFIEPQKSPSALPSDAQIQAIYGHLGHLGQGQELTALMHTFTHFKLHMQVLHVHLTPAGEVEPWIWGEFRALEKLALPTPIKTILKTAHDLIHDDAQSLPLLRKTLAQVSPT